MILRLRTYLILFQVVFPEKETSDKIKKLQLEKELKKVNVAEKRNKQSYNLLRNLKSTWNFMTFDERRTIIEHIVDRVILYNNEIKKRCYVTLLFLSSKVIA